MRIVIITQSDPFYLSGNIKYLIQNLPRHSQIVACILSDVSPFGKKESFLQKTRKTLNIFGWQFFLRYSFLFLKSKLTPKNSVQEVFASHNIPVLKLEGSINSQESLTLIKSYEPDLLISIAGNQIFKQKLIDLAPKGCLNLHTALLPKYRGLMPSFWVLKNEEKQTGVSIFFVDEGIDSGPILVQKIVDIGNMTQEELIKKTKKIGMDAIIESIEKINSGTYTLISNPESEKTYFSFPTREDVQDFYRKGKRFY